MSEERVAIFIDGANLFHALIDEFDNLNLDFDKLAHKLNSNPKIN